MVYNNNNLLVVRTICICPSLCAELRKSSKTVWVETEYHQRAVALYYDSLLESLSRRPRSCLENTKRLIAIATWLGQFFSSNYSDQVLVLLAYLVDHVELEDARNCFLWFATGATGVRLNILNSTGRRQRYIRTNRNLEWNRPCLLWATGCRSA